MEDEISLTWEDFVGDHLKSVVVTRSWIWRDCLWRNHSWTPLIHEERQIDLGNNFFKCCWLFVASCNTCRNCKRCMGQSLCNIWENTHWQKTTIMLRAYNLKLKEGTLVQVHIEKLPMITNQLPNIDHQVFNEDLAFNFLKGFLLSMNLCGFI